MNLVIYKKKAPKRFWPVDKEQLSIGRSSRADITLNDPRVSRIHAYVIKDEEKAFFIDANSTNGSFVNGVHTKRHLLQPGDIICVGSTELHVVESEQSTDFSWDDTNIVVQSEYPLDYLHRQLDVITREIDESVEKPDSKSSLKTIEPQYDVKIVDKKIVELQNFLYKADSKIKQSNAITTIDMDVGVDSLLEPLQ